MFDSSAPAALRKLFVSGEGQVAIGNLARLVRSSVLEVKHEDYVRTARAKGLPETGVMLRHALRNALIPIVTMIGLQLGLFMSGAVITETVFARQGIGALLIDAIVNKMQATKKAAE